VPQPSTAAGGLARRLLRDALPVAAWCALVAGLLEVAMLIHKHRQGASIHLGQEFFWMTPAADILLFAAVALLLVPVLAVFHRRNTFRIATTAFVALAMVSVLMHVGWMAAWARWLLALGVGVQAGRLVSDHEVGARRGMMRTLPVLAVLALCVGIAGHVRLLLQEQRALRPVPASPARPPNVLLIVWDAVRPSDLSLYGYSRPTTPNLDAFAREGVVFERAQSTASYTLPSHVSLFTGRWAHQLQASWLVPMGKRAPTIAAALSDRGYRTAAFSANHAYVSWEFGVLRGFGWKSDYVLSWGALANSSAVVRWAITRPLIRRLDPALTKVGRRDSENIRRHFLDWLDGGEPQRPFFAFINMFDGHDPYLPGVPYDTLFGWPGNAESGERMRVRRLTTRDPLDLPAADAARLRDLYDGGIAKMDQSVGRLLDGLRQRGVLDNTIVIVTADHGEAFGEHKMFGHGNSVFTEELQVPLVMRGPGITKGVRASGVASLRNIAATIGDLAHVPDEAWPLPGVSLASHWRAGQSRSDTALAEIDQLPREGRPWFPVRRGNVRTIIAWPYQVITVGKNVELYDLSADPAQHDDLADHPELAATRDSLLAALKRFRVIANMHKRD
jgi:arylsulfatase A-like enzyme